MSTLSESSASRSRMRVEVGVGAHVGLVLLPRGEVALGAQPGAGEQHLADLQEQQRDRPAAVRLAGDRLQGQQEALHLVGDLLGEVLGLGVTTAPGPPTMTSVSVIVGSAQPISFPRTHVPG